MYLRTLALLLITVLRVGVAPLHPKARTMVAKSVPKSPAPPRHGIAPANCACCSARRDTRHRIKKRRQ